MIPNAARLGPVEAGVSKPVHSRLGDRPLSAHCNQSGDYTMTLG